jgi:hypothetical protein
MKMFESYASDEVSCRRSYGVQSHVFWNFFMFLVKHESRTYCYSGCVTDGQGAITLGIKLRGHYFPFYGEKEIWKCGNSSTFLSIQVFSSISSALAFYDIFVDARLTSTKISAHCCKSANFLSFAT